MAKPGPKPLPTQLKVVHGESRPSRIRKNEPKPKADKLKRPFKLSHVASVQWTRVSKQLKDANIITNIDTHALAMYCEAYATWRHATDMINSDADGGGAVVQGQNGGLVQSAHFHVAAKSFAQMHKLLVEFGMTPSARTRVSSTVENPDDDDF